MTAPPRAAARPEIAHHAAAEARAEGRPLILRWLKSVEAKVRTKKLRDLDYRLAVILTNYPSANVGKCWAGQKRLSDQAGRCERTIREALGRLGSEGLLKTRRGGQGRTSCYSFAVDGCEMFGRQRGADLDRQNVAGLDRQQVAAKPFELKPTEQEDSLPTLSHGGGDVINLTAERRARKPAITGYNFLANCHRQPGCLDGPALAAWNRLPPADQQAIWRIVERDGAIVLGEHEGPGVWACTFLKNRMWEPLISKPPNWAAPEQLFPNTFARQQTFAGRVFVQEDSQQWDAWARRYREHGAPNGTHVGPWAFSYDGKQGNFFASEWPPQ
jgi:hypothetical protein